MRTIVVLNLVLFIQFTLLGWRANAQIPPWPEWIFYHWVWEGESTQQSAIQIVDDYLQYDIPVGAIIIDSPWETGYNNFQFDTALFQDAQGMINYFHSKNIRVLLWITSFMNIEVDSLYNYAKSQSYFMRKNSQDDSTLINWWKGDGRLIDLFNPAAVSWWKGMMDSALALGIDGWKCDGSDFSVLNAPFSPYMNVNISRIDYSDKYYRLFFDSTRSALGNDRIILARPVD
ncbi:MAG: TIM-barrel domain-containing protein, partial [Bacteroidota bacterium]